MKTAIIAFSIFLFVLILHVFGPEFFQYNTYKVYKEITDLKKRVEKLENR